MRLTVDLGISVQVDNAGDAVVVDLGTRLGYLVGFQRTELARIDIPRGEFYADPQSVMGTYPVFSDDAGLYTLCSRVTGVN